MLVATRSRAKLVSVTTEGIEMGNKNYDKGASLENDVATSLDNNGYATIRAAGSGTADRPSCDVLAVDQSEVLLIECKTYKDGSSSLVSKSDHKQMTELHERIHDTGLGGTGCRDVVTALVLREDGSFSPRFVSPFPEWHVPSGDERLFSNHYK